MTRRKIQLTIILVFGVLVVLNYLGNKIFFRLDYTADQIYTLSDATHKILDDLSEVAEPVSITAYFSEDMPPELLKGKEDFESMLEEYHTHSDGMVNYEFINPNSDEELEKQANQDGITPRLVNDIEKDKMTQKKVYLGAVIKLGDQVERIPVVQSGAAMEYELSSKIMKIAATDKPSVAWLQGHGETPLSSMSQALSKMSILNKVEPLYLNDTSSIPLTYKSLAIVAPTDSFHPSHLQQISDYVSSGGNLFIAINRVSANLNQGSGAAQNTGLEVYLESRGITVQPNFVVDINCGSIAVMQQQGPFQYQVPVQFPYLPLINNFADHPASKGLEGVMFQFASSVNVSVDEAVKATPIAITSSQSSMQLAPVYFDVQKQWTVADFPESGIPIAYAFEGPIGGNESTKMVVVGDGDFATSGDGQERRNIPDDNVNFMVNSIDWLSDETGLNALRTKGVTSRPLDKIDESTKTLIKWGNFFAPILLIIIYGMIRFHLRRRKRLKWMNERYV